MMLMLMLMMKKQTLTKKSSQLHGGTRVGAALLWHGVSFHWHYVVLCAFLLLFLLLLLVTMAAALAQQLSHLSSCYPLSSSRRVSNALNHHHGSRLVAHRNRLVVGA
jgi:hypothetical protein